MSDAPSRKLPDRRPDRSADRFTVDADGGETVIEIVDAVATYLQIDPLALEPQLGTRIDCDALENLIATDAGDVEISFEFASCSVTVTNDGTVFLDDA